MIQRTPCAPNAGACVRFPANPRVLRPRTGPRRECTAGAESLRHGGGGTTIGRENREELEGGDPDAGVVVTYGRTPLKRGGVQGSQSVARCIWVKLETVVGWRQGLTGCCPFPCRGQ
jgi:hypothetical protein